MNIRTVLLGIAGTAMLSSAALAATAEVHTGNRPASNEQMADRCATLESQYQSAITGHIGDAAFDKAEGLGSSGTSECQADEGTIGAQKLEQALADLGVKALD